MKLASYECDGRVCYGVVTEDGVQISDIEEEVTAIVDEKLANITDVTREIIEGERTTF